MGNELIPNSNCSTELDVFEALEGLGDGFLPRLQLFSGRSDACSEGLIPINHYGIVDGDNIIDLGERVVIGVLAVRSKAMCTQGDVQCSYKQDSELFKQLVVDSGVKDSGCMYGPEFLVYIPSIKRFATYFMGSKTARREAKKFKPLMNKPAILDSKNIEKGKYKWRGPVILPCADQIELPPLEKLEEEVNKFRNPPEDTVEVAEEDGRER